MTIDQSILSDVGSNVAHARVFRALGSAFVRSGGLVSAGDLAVTGDPSLLAVNVDVGIGMVPYTSALQYFEPFEVDAPEQRALATATGARVDLVYAAVQSMEFGNSANGKDIKVVRGANGSTHAPNPDPTMAGVLPLASVQVPSGATRGTDCTITMLAQTTAPVRDGGYTPDDLGAVAPTIWTGKLTNKTVGAGGYGGYAHGAPFTPVFAVVVPQFPNDSSQAGFSTFAPGHFHNDSCDANFIHGIWYSKDGTVAPTGANFSAWYVCYANLGAVG